MNQYSLFTFILTITLATAQAQQDSLSLDEVVVTAHRIHSKISQTPATVSLLSEKQFRKQLNRSVPEMLMNMPGVFMQKTGHAGGSPFLRGLTGYQILQITDGIRLNNSTFRFGPNQYLSTIDPFTIQQVEVVRGNGGTLHGSDAIGGVVSILSRELAFSDTSALHGSFSLQGMSRNMDKSSSTRLTYSDKRFAAELIGTLSDFGDIVGANRFIQSPSSYQQQAIHLKTRTKLSANTTLTTLFQQLGQQNVHLPDQIRQRGFLISRIDPQKRQLSYIRVDASLRSFFSDQIRITLSRQLSAERRIRQRLQSPILTTEYDHVGTWGIQAEARKNIRNNWQMISGIDIYTDKVSSSTLDQNYLVNAPGGVRKRGLYADQSAMSSLSLFHHHQWHGRKWDFSAGFRLNRYGLRIPDKTFGYVNLTPHALAWNAGAIYALHKNWQLIGQLNTAYRTPNINDLSSFGKFDFGTEVPSPSLNPETSFNKEIGIRRISGKTFISLMLYHNNLNNLIDRIRATYLGDSIFNGDKVFTKANVGNTTIYGLELEARTQLAKNLYALAHFTYTYGQNHTLNEPVRRIPPAFGRLSAEYQKNEFFIAADWIGATAQKRLATGDKSDHRINPNGTPGWGIFSIRSGYQLNAISIQVGIENILDQAYRLHGSGIDGYGRMAWIRTSFQF